MNKYLIIIEQTENGYSAYSPDIPGCVAAADTISETEVLMKEAMEFHIEGMIAEGLKVPLPVTSKAEFVELAV
jgi:predicted RNase H-like HicB family nuclease